MSEQKEQNLSGTRVIPRRLALREAARRAKKEKHDPKPVEAITQRERPLTLREEMQRFVREQVSQQAEQAGADSFDDFDDFEIDDGEMDITTPYTVPDVEQEFTETLDGQPTAEDLAPAEEGAQVEPLPGGDPVGDEPTSPPTHGGQD